MSASAFCTPVAVTHVSCVREWVAGPSNLLLVLLRGWRRLDVARGVATRSLRIPAFRDQQQDRQQYLADPMALPSTWEYLSDGSFGGYITICMLKQDH